MRAIGGMRVATALFLALALVCGLLLFAGIGHGLHDSMASDDGVATAGVGICLVLFTLLVPLALLPPAARRTVVPAGPTAEATLVRPGRPTAVARASPAWLQRFLN